MKQKYETGAAVVEFALVLPVLLLVFDGIIEFGLALYDQAVITNAAREGARAGIVLRNPKFTPAQITTVALNYCQANLISLGGASSPTVSVVQSPTPDLGTPLSVTVTYTYKGLVLGQIISALHAPITMSATSVMNNE